MDVKIWVFALCYNEAYMMPYFLRHYSTFAERIIVYDSQSTDGTRELVEACPKAELRDFTKCEDIDDEVFVNFVNDQYKEARGQADWVIWPDCDEFVYHPNLSGLLQGYQNRGVNIAHVRGYLMVADSPVNGGGQIYDSARFGLPDRMCCKPLVWSPDIENVGFESGRHLCFPTKDACWSERHEIKILHYRYFGRDYLRERNAKQFSRLSERNQKAKLGFQVWPDYVGEWDENWYDKVAKPARVDALND